MSVSLYREKRNFNETPEPAGVKKGSTNALRFVVQKHDATGLHYDFRLELEGVLKSWAVPKGPSLNPADKRLARAVEDHPYDYRTFEDVIPEGAYGGGTVIVWDEGTYEPAEATGVSKKEQEKTLLQQLQKGSLKIVLHGQKLKGAFTLFQLKRDKEGKSWLLVKKGDDFATSDDVMAQNTSVLSGKTIAQVAADNGVTPHHPEAENEAAPLKGKTKVSTAKKQTKAAASKSSTKVSAVKGKEKVSAPAKSLGKKVQWVEDLLGNSLPLAKKEKMPLGAKPMLATLIDAPFDSNDWLFEIKWDGYRALAYLDDDKVDLVSRNQKSFTGRYGAVTSALQSLSTRAVLDGEIVGINEKGLADFQALQNWKSNPDLRLQYYVFDILWLDGYNVTALPLVERKRLLQQILPKEHDVIKYSDDVKATGKDFFKVALKEGLEGIMAKKLSSVYNLGSRTEDWVKIKVAKRQEVIICGFTAPRNSRQFFGALLLGVYKGKKLTYVGHTGSGFTKESLQAIHKQLQPLIVDACPFAECPRGNMPVTWVAPKTVCEIKFTEWTKEGIARHPIFMGLRGDKKPTEVTVENTTDMSAIVKKGSTKTATAPAKKAPKAATKGKEKVSSAKGKTKVLNAKEPSKKSSSKIKTSGLQLDFTSQPEQIITLNSHELKLTNLQKPYWKKEGFTKGDTINYYLRMAPYILPYLINRPQSLNRHPNGVGAPHFFQKDMRGKLPDWMQTHEDFSESTDVTVQYLVCKDEATLIYMANLGCIEINPWHSRVQSVLNPDWCLIDLDPDKKNTFDQVIQTAHVVKEILDAAGAPCYPKTSGSTGLHIYIPLGAQYSYEQSKGLAELVVHLVQQQLPDLTSVERNPEKRKGKIYLDFLQNRETQTAAAPYSLRPKPGAPVSAPLHWDEVKKGLTTTTYNLQNIFDRVKREGDIFNPILGKGIQLEKVLQKVQALVP